MKLNIKSEAAAGIVAGASFAGSAGHIMSVVNETNPWWISPVYPIGIDGLIFVGIRAMQTGRKGSGILALTIGAFYSLAFNMHAEGALTMPKFLIASSLPVCMFVAFLIEAIAKTEKAPEPEPQVIEKVVEVEKIVYAYPELLPIVPPTPKAKPVARPRPAAVDAPKVGRGRTAGWDVEKAVRLLMDGRTEADVLAAVDGLTEKPLQRTKRAVRLLTADASQTDEVISDIVGQSAGHIARVRAAMKEAK